MALSDNKRIVFNSAVLYTKLVLSMLIGLYTSRIVLNALGASDYGLYSLVGGLVTMMNFFGTSMTSVTNRFILIEMGKKESGNCNRVFNTSLAIHFFLAILLCIIGETVGIWYLNSVANIQIDKINDAIFVLHLSMLSCVFSILSVPYNGLIIAREKFVYTSIIEIVRHLIKLILVLWLGVYLGNRLRAFSVIMCLFNLILPISFFIYCLYKDKETIRLNINTKLNDYWDMLKFSFWMAIGALACLGQAQFSHMVINIFFGTILNAAYGIANTVNSYVMMFVKSFNQAALPQIMKNIDSNNDRSVSLVYSTTRLSFFIFGIPAIPILININYILQIWLKDVPPFTSVFASTLLLTSLIRTLGAGFDATIQATGRIWVNQLVYSIIYLSVVPIAYCLYKYGLPENTINVCILIASIFVLCFQTYYLSKISSLSIRGYLRKTIIPVLKVIFALVPLFSFVFLLQETTSFFIISSLFCIIWTSYSIYKWGLFDNERNAINKYCYKLFSIIEQF